ncbi:MAG: Nramp family divalent metal transporter [Parvularcula sp.]|nr:Nramp family divalent metal transporter [Parvularcula sp.]
MTGKRSFGPGALVAAAFIGPGTVTTCTLAGAGFGTALLWVLIASVLAAMVLQEMSARLGAVTGQGLAYTLRQISDRAWVRRSVYILVGVSILLGNAAYQGGNLSGAALGFEAAFADALPPRVVTLLIALLAAVLLWFGSAAVLGAALSLLVLVLAIAFAITAVMAAPALGEAWRAAFRFTLPEGSLTTALALIGTTIVPYNLFLHASASAEAFGPSGDVHAARRDTLVFVALGGLISSFVMITAAGTLMASGEAVDGAAGLARQLEPLFGSFARVVFGAGLLAAGLTSAVTAPMAAGAVALGLAGRPFATQDRLYKAVAFAILATGAGFAISGIRPLELILLAQAANGFLLPGVATLLLAVMNKGALMGRHRNGTLANSVACGAIAVAVLIGGRLVIGVAARLMTS